MEVAELESWSWNYQIDPDSSHFFNYTPWKITCSISLYSVLIVLNEIVELPRAHISTCHIQRRFSRKGISEFQKGRFVFDISLCFPICK